MRLIHPTKKRSRLQEMRRAAPGGTPSIIEPKLLPTLNLAASRSANLDRNDDPVRGSTPRLVTMRHWITSFRLLTILSIYRRPAICQSARDWHFACPSANGRG